MDKQGHVYVLQLADDCWYVGWSQDIQTRICSHFLGAGSKWTMLHRPISVHSVKPGCCLQESLTTLALMCQFGWEKVRERIVLQRRNDETTSGHGQGITLCQLQESSERARVDFYRAAAEYYRLHSHVLRQSLTAPRPPPAGMYQ